MKRTRAALALAGASGVLVAGLSGPALAAPAAAAGVCNLKVLSLQANDLNEETRDGDETRIELGDSRFGPYDFLDDQKRTASLGDVNEDFVGSIQVALVEDDLIGDDPIGAAFTQSCTPGTFTKVRSGSGAIYTLVYTVTA
jgi:hypothetical protein